MPRRARARFASDPVLQPVFEAKLASSGLSLDHAAALGYRALDVAAVRALGSWAASRPALLIPYHDLDGSPLSDVPAGEPFYRLRYLGGDASFTAAVKAGKEQRYAQPPATHPCVYLPPLVDWRALAEGEDALLITEGELKAAAACAAGFPCVGLGGVWNFRSAPRGVFFDKTLERFRWLRRNVYLVFDSDLSTNPNVAAALSALAYELEQRGAYAHLVWLPTVLGPSEKVGLDDFLLFHGERAEEALTRLLRDADLLGLVDPLLQLNAKYVYVADPGMVFQLKTLARYKPSALKEHLETKTSVFVRKLGPDGSTRYEKATAINEWFKWPLRTEADAATYTPGKGRFIKNGRCLFNTWRGWGCEPRKGNVKPFLKLIDRLFEGAEPWAKTWFLRWLAYPLQYPGQKLFTDVLVHGLVTGSGKSLVAYTMGRIYGKNFTVIKQKDLHSDFNEWAEHKQFVLADDVTGSDNREYADILKTLITQEEIRINAKFLPTYTIPDCLNYFFTSNQVDAFFLEDDDRRHFIHETFAARMTEGDKHEFFAWRDAGGVEALFDWFLKLDLGDFDPTAPAPVTAAKERMIADGRSDLATWVRALLADPERHLRVGSIPIARDLFTAAELLTLYDPHGKGRVSANGLTRELKRAKAAMVHAGAPVRTAEGLVRLFAIRHPDRWAAATPAAIAKHRDENGVKRGKY